MFPVKLQPRKTDHPVTLPSFFFVCFFHSGNFSLSHKIRSFQFETQLKFRRLDNCLKMFLKICVLLCALSVAQVLGGKTKKTACTQMTPMKSFNSGKFAGRWYEIKRDSSFDQIETLEGTCTYLNFSVAAGNNLSIALSTVLQNRAIKSHAPVKISSDGQFDWSITIGPGKRRINSCFRFLTIHVVNSYTNSGLYCLGH